MTTRFKVSNSLFVVFVLAILLCGCEKDSSSSDSSAVTSKNIQACIQPHNPYNDGGGHDAGFNWAMENGGGCDGNSDSFNEGCAEYHRQLNQYNECIANKR